MVSTAGIIGISAFDTASMSATGIVSLTSSGSNIDISANNNVEIVASTVDIRSSLNVTGGITGDVTGSVFADDSAVIVDGITGAVTPSEFKPPMLTQAQIDALTPVEGLMVYNTTTGKFQGYAADANNDSTTGWADLH